MDIIRSIQNRIYDLRGQRVMLDRDLAALYGSQTKSLNLAVKRNRNRFPGDFMFRLTKEEFEGLRFQIETLEKKDSLRLQIETSKDSRNVTHSFSKSLALPVLSEVKLLFKEKSATK